VVCGLFEPEEAVTRKAKELIYEGKYAAEVSFGIIEDDTTWSPYLSPEVARTLEILRLALRRGDTGEAAKHGRIFMPSPVYNLFRNAILAEQQVVCTYDGHHRELCPLIIGTNKDSEEVVLAWQFAGAVGKGKLPIGGAWKCLKLANVRNARTRDGSWHEGGSHKTQQRCVAAIDLDINIHVRKNRR
jgi:hypothetical protein